MIAITVLVAVYATVIAQGAMALSGDDPVAARVAESARNHGLGAVVTALEELQYRFHPPRTGGLLPASAMRSLVESAAPSLAARSGTAARQGLQPTIPAVAGRPLPGEGVYSVTVRNAAGRPAVEVAFLRPDQAHTSYLAAVAWMDSRLLRFVQHPGSADPGQLSRWSQPATVPPSARRSLAATFNGGFKIVDSRGGYYADGITVHRLRQGAASLVIYRDGHVAIGAWGRDAGMTADVVSVRQNLDLLVDESKVSDAVNAGAGTGWGRTVNSADYVWRSGIGVTSSGDLVYVAGDALSAVSLAVLLQHAGAVRAMELDINRAWISYMWYSSGAGGPVPHKLTDFQRPADRYFGVSSRDFFAVYLR